MHSQPSAFRERERPFAKGLSHPLPPNMPIAKTLVVTDPTHLIYKGFLLTSALIVARYRLRMLGSARSFAALLTAQKRLCLFCLFPFFQKSVSFHNLLKDFHKIHNTTLKTDKADKGLPFPQFIHTKQTISPQPKSGEKACLSLSFWAFPHFPQPLLLLRE